MTIRVLILGGTGEARQLASRLAGDGRYVVTVSLAGRTADPLKQAVDTRIGGFGGVDGLVRYLADHRIDVLIDATHPFAAKISANAAAAARQTGCLILGLRRPAWEPVDGDRWHLFRDIETAVSALGSRPRRVFAAFGRQELQPLLAAPQHSYLVRSVDPIDPPLDLPDVTALVARGPFSVAGEEQLLRRHRIDAIIAKNSGGDATYCKIVAARRLGIDVHLVKRPDLPEIDAAADIVGLIGLLDHFAGSIKERGV